MAAGASAREVDAPPPATWHGAGRSRWAAKGAGSHLLACLSGFERSSAAGRARRDVPARPLPADSLARARSAEDDCEDGPRMLNPPYSHWTIHSEFYTSLITEQSEITTLFN